MQDELLGQFGHQAEKAAFKSKGFRESGLISVSRPGQEIIERSGCEIHPVAGDIFASHGSRTSCQWSDNQWERLSKYFLN